MCLNIQWTNKQKKEWLKNKPKTITAYKVCSIYETDGVKELFPPVYAIEHGPFKRTNIMLKRELEDSGKLCWVKLSSTKTDSRSYGSVPYNANYHLFSTRKAASKWSAELAGEMEVLKCEIPKECITVIGRQMNCVVIVTKKFKFVEGLEYFGKKKMPVKEKVA